MKQSTSFALLGVMAGLVAPAGLAFYGLVRGTPDPMVIFATLVAGGVTTLGLAGFAIGQREDTLAAKNEELQKLSAQLAAESRTDALTGIPNRRAFDDEYGRALATSIRYGTPLTVVMIDLDRFKRLNDTHGHAVGDVVLRHVANVLDGERREGDLLARYGGEEFVCALPHTSAEQAAAWAERVRRVLAEGRVATEAGHLAVTASFGVAARSSGITTPTALLSAADTALYQAKEEGRNRVHVFRARTPTGG